MEQKAFSQRKALKILAIAIYGFAFLSKASSQNITITAQGSVDQYYGGNSTNYFWNGTFIDGSSYPHRIVGGQPIGISQAPWQVAIIRNRQLYCGGSIISRFWVLTAAHCIIPGGSYVVRGGTRFFKHGGQTRRVNLRVLHGHYNSRTSNNDVALLRLSRGFRFGRSVRTVWLARPRMRIPRSYFVSGWGLQNENQQNPSSGLRAVTVSRISQRTCARKYRGYSRITRKMICAAAPGRDACYADSGGPLVKNRWQYGIVSFGIGCARRRFPGVYTDVRRVRSWINYVRRRFR